MATATGQKPVVIGLYGISGCGKSFLLKELAEKLKDKVDCVEGSDTIARLVTGGLDAFQRLNKKDKKLWRGRAIEEIVEKATSSQRAALVAGHLMFWSEGGEQQSVWTTSDSNAFTHIIYLDVSADDVARRCLNYTEKNRTAASTNHLRQWQQAEIKELRRICHEKSILFSLVRPDCDDVTKKVSSLVEFFCTHTPETNLEKAKARLDGSLAEKNSLKTVLVLDGDRTMANVDTGNFLWEKLRLHKLDDGLSPLQKLFGGPMRYSEPAFVQASLIQEEAFNDEGFEQWCKHVAEQVNIYPELMSLLLSIEKQNHITAVVLTCGLGQVWEEVLNKAGLGNLVSVVGGGRVSDGFVVTAAVKESLVRRLRDAHGLYVYAFGDSPLDLPMLASANEAIVVVGEERSRSKSMDNALAKAIDKDGLQARQALLPGNVKPRLDLVKLPRLDITSRDFINSVISRRNNDNIQIQVPRVLHATDRPAAKLLMTPMRDANNFGPTLQEGHVQVGRYLAMELLSNVIGLEEYSIPHVQGFDTTGYRFQNEKETKIIALMRGGEPMARGVHQALPLAGLVHASSPGDVRRQHLAGAGRVILVDSVINSGKTMADFVQYIHQLHPGIRMVVLAGVIQNKAVAEGHRLMKLMALYGVDFVALRLSDNAYKGTKGTDTGNRLFNTTRLN